MAGIRAASLTRLRMHVEACIDFPEEEIDPSDRHAQRVALAEIRAELDTLLAQAAQGAVLRDGLTVVFKGVPAQVCPNCGEDYVEQAIADRLIEEAEQTARNGTQVEVRQFAAA